VLPNRPDEGAEIRLWPLGGWHDTARQRAYLYYGQVRTTGGGGPFDFRVVGHGLARADITQLETLRFERIGGPQGGVWWAGGGPLFGSSVVMAPPRSDGYLYVVGGEERDGRQFGKLARVRPQQIEESGAYEYLAGPASAPRWSHQAMEATDVEGLTDFPNELSVAYNAYLGGYLAVHSVGITPRLRLCLAPHPWGPYRSLGEIGAPHQAFAKAFCYAGKEHPELAEGAGRVIYVTYVDSQRYWLQLLKITLAR
jgi:hypothetical protein